jgi:UDP-N-acetylmuramoyl-L-alanyl-D-glutamate--2,6-diaminopimelate ligase
MNRILRRCIDFAHSVYSICGTLRYWHSLKSMHIIGITGTDGKSSTVYFLANLLAGSGKHVAHYSSFSYNNGSGVEINTKKMTTPGKGALHHFLHTAFKNRCTHAVLEITSEGIKQNRHFGIPFVHAGITNISKEHIESHGGYEQYVRAKLSFLESTLAKKHGVCTACVDTDTLLVWAAHRPGVITLAWSQNENGYTYDIASCDLEHATFTLRTPSAETVTCTLPYGGPFVARNVALALAMAHREGVPLEDGLKTLTNLSMPPGRFEVLHKNPYVIVDYAHTIAALEELLPFIRRHINGNILHVFGAAGGGRDTYKRPILAKLSEQYTDYSIVTEENPWDEQPEQIEKDIMSGFSDSKHSVEVIRTREDAVRRAFAIVKSDDCILLTAKGAETVIAGAHGVRRPYVERDFVRNLCTSI